MRRNNLNWSLRYILRPKMMFNRFNRELFLPKGSFGFTRKMEKATRRQPFCLAKQKYVYYGQLLPNDPNNKSRSEVLINVSPLMSAGQAFAAGGKIHVPSSRVAEGLKFTALRYVHPAQV